MGKILDINILSGGRWWRAECDPELDDYEVMRYICEDAHYVKVKPIHYYNKPDEGNAIFLNLAKITAVEIVREVD